jgi:hypothetical protein
MKIPVFLPVTRELGLRDEFAQDCLLQRRVSCELPKTAALRRSSGTNGQIALGGVLESGAGERRHGRLR